MGIIASEFIPVGNTVNRLNHRDPASFTEEQTARCDLGECRTNLLPMIREMSRIVTESGNLETILYILLQLMQRYLKVVRGMVNLYDAASGQIFIHQSLGLTGEEAARGVYYLGEGITGKVVETGQSIVVPRISEEPDFLNRTCARDAISGARLSFICVPILRGRKVMGTISAERIYDNRRLLDLDVEIVSILAAMTAQSVEFFLMESVYNAALQQENYQLRDALKEKFKPSNIIGNSKPMQKLYTLIEKIARTKTTVLILGESGVGKELVAGAIHYNGVNASGPFVKFNCAALTESVIESELFGHEKGSFTGAYAQRKGRFEEADGGTIFLDEVGELSLPIQAKLLRILQERAFERVGSNITHQVDLRILAATNRDLADMVAKGNFREDLYYRLNVYPITVPPLRERDNDIIALADYFVGKFSQRMGVKIKRISTPALNMLVRYYWPGNVRELENVMERAVVLAAEGGVIHGYHLPPSLQTPLISEVSCEGGLETRLAVVEYEMIVEALKLHNGNMTNAANHLGLTRRMLGLRLQRYKLNYKAFR